MTRRRGDVCGGCWRRCDYADFRDFVPVVRLDVREPAARRRYGDVRHDQGAKIARDIAEGVGGTGATRRTVLREMRREKRSMWERATAGCHLRGEDAPATLADALEWAASVPARDFRVLARGWDPERARAHRGGPVSVREFARWWRSVRQVRIPFGRWAPEAETQDPGAWV